MSMKNLSTLSLLGAWVRDLVNGRVYNPVLTDDFILGAASTEYVTGTELKMFFDRSKAALHGGSITGAGHDDANRGNFSLSWGSNAHRATGADAVALGNNAQATGDQSFAAAGSGSLASGSYSAAFSAATASGNNSFAANGNGTTASGLYSAAFGSGCTASGNRSFMHGPSPLAATRYSQYAHGGAVGEAQYNRFLAAVTTTNATPAVATFDQAAVALTGTSTNVLTLPVSKGHKFTVHVIARRTGTDAHASWEIKGSIVRYSTGNAKFISTPTVVSDKESAASAWDCGVSIVTTDATNNYLAVTVTGAASSTIKWAVCIETVEFP